MTPAERAVLDAARAMVPGLNGLLVRMRVDSRGVVFADSDDLKWLDQAATDFLAAVRALPRPLSEQLAELRPGAKVEIAGGLQREFVMLSPLSGRLFIYEPMKDCVVAVSESMVTRIISNPEESNG